jgi:hypothetical protein
MVRLHFETTEEFTELFKAKKVATTQSIVIGIEKAMQGNTKSAGLFEVTFADTERMFEISLPRNQWVDALESCLEHYHELSLADEAIDTWKLLEAAKLW